MGLLDWALQWAPAQKKLKEQERKEQTSRESVTRVTGQTLKKQLGRGQINQNQFNQRYDESLRGSTPQIGKWTQRNAHLADAVSDNYVSRNLLAGLAATNPISVVGNATAYTGRGISALGGNGRGITRFGDKLGDFGQVDRNAPAKTAFQSRGMKDDLFRGGIGLGGDIANSFNPITRAATLGKYFTTSSNDLARNMEQAGYGPKSSFLTGSALGTVNAGLERTGLNKITGGTGSKVTGNVLRRSANRIAGSALTEGATEGAQQFADNAFGKATYDPSRNLMQGVKESAAAGAILGGGARVPFEIGNSQVRQDASKAAKTIQIKASESMIPGDMLRLRRQYQEAYDKETNPTRKKQISKALTDLNTQIKQVTQGGYVAGPGASQDYKKLPDVLPAQAPPSKLPSDEWQQIMSRPEAQPRAPIEIKDNNGKLAIKRGDKEIQTDAPNIKEKIDGNFKQSTNQYLGSMLAAPTQARKFMEKLPKLDKSKSEQAILAIDSGRPTGDPEIDAFAQQFKAVTDSLYATYKNNGMDIGYVDNYLPRIYRDPKTGENMTAQEYDFLQRSSGRNKGRVAESVDTANLRFKNPEELLGHYVKTMERVTSGRQYFNNLKQQGFVVEAGTKPQGMKLIDAEGITPPSLVQLEDGTQVQGAYYAYPDVAEDLNRVFGTQRENKALKKVARASSIMQDIGLSGGVPGTPINSFAFAQLTKDVLAGNLKGPAIALKNSFKKSSANKYFTDNADAVTEMQKAGISVSTDYNIQAVRDLSNDISQEDGKIARAWEKTMSDPTFKRFMPILQVEMYKNVKAHSDAKTAAEAVKNFYGLTDLATSKTRSKNANNLTTTVFFAPKFRESMVKFWVNNMRSVGLGTNGKRPTVKISNLTDSSLNTNRKFMAGATIMFGVMQAMNIALNGVPTWGNPDGKEDKLIIPGGRLTGGKDVGIPFLSSIATVPRNLFMLGKNTVSGDAKEAGQNAKSFVSFGARPALDVALNENYFGSRIYDPEATGGEKLGSQASYMFKAYQHPYIREGLNVASNKLPDNVKKFTGAREQSSLETASKAAESPLRFYNPDYYRGQDEGFRGGITGSGTREKDTISITDTSEKKGNKYVSRSKYDAITDAYSSDGEGSIKVTDYDTNELRSAIKTVSKEAKSVLADMGLEDPGTPDSLVAQEWSKFMQKVESGDISELSYDSEFTKTARSIYKKSLSKTGQELIGMSDGNIRTAMEKGLVSKEEMDRVIALDNYMVQNDLLSYAYIGKTLRRELGYGYVSSKSGSRSGGGGKGGSKKAKSIGAAPSKQNLAKITAAINNASPQVKILKVNPQSIAAKGNIQIKKSAAPKAVSVRYS